MRLLFGSIFCLYAFVFAQPSAIHHSIEARLEPDKAFLEVRDTITFPDQDQQQIEFLLLSDFKLHVLTPGIELETVETNISAKDIGMDQEENTAAIRQNRYRLTGGNLESVTLSYSGRVYFPILELAQEYARGFSQTPGLIDTMGAYLGGSTYWLPWINDEFVTFDLLVDLPADWDAVSQGKRVQHAIKAGRRLSQWSCDFPMEEVYLIAAPFHEYHLEVGNIDVMAFLRSPDDNLANKYLQTTGQYLEMYRKLIGPFPFSKFALVENFWETGYGMPSFTLLGPQVIRFPFILHSSYPHELLHNYWGNSVYVDFDSGNWCEGITAYMADHLIKEQRGQAKEYRRTVLQKFTDYVNPSNDFPLSDFGSRYDAASEAIGYGKSSMLWDMLRYRLGDEQFVKCWQDIYNQQKFKQTSFQDIETIFQDMSDLNLEPFFDQWIHRTGAPELQLTEPSLKETGTHRIIHFTLQQTQQEEPFDLMVPVGIVYNDSTSVQNVSLTKRKQDYSIRVTDRPLALQVDPQFNVFRRLHANEIPPSLSAIFGAEKVLIVLPAAAAGERRAAYDSLALRWSQDSDQSIVAKLDSEIDTLPNDHAIWIFGCENRFAPVIAQGLKPFDSELKESTFLLEKKTFPLDKHSSIVAVRHPYNPKSVAVMLVTDSIQAAMGLSRKLPHYGKYSTLVFEGTEPTNTEKGQWPAVNSPLVHRFEPGAELVSFPEREALAKLEPLFSAKRMLKTVEILSESQMQGRGLATEGIDRAATYIADRFAAAGLEPGAADGTFFQKWIDGVDAKGNTDTLKNIIAVLPGSKTEFAGQSVVICAHYDHLGYGWPDVRDGNKGKLHPGADDNASGVAVMLELAENLAQTLKPDRDILLIAFTAEENGLAGSEYYVQNPVRALDKTMGVLNLDTVGRLGDRKIMVINSNSAKEWKFIFMGVGYVTGVEADLITQDLDASDQKSFIDAGVPAVQLFSGPHHDYHRPTDTTDKIDAQGLVRVATFTRETLLYLAERPEPMTFTGKPEAGGHPGQALAAGERRASTGTMPDFGYQGKGMKINAVSAGSAAEKAGMQKGDVIVEFNSKPIENLRDYSNALKQQQPGDEVKLVFIRGEKEMHATIVLQAR
jgi:aminopeptidase N